uniref:WD_REPEATS_REGION domain-containing protein n=1 Tax=Gongylonema pulchrum TaxID=637853 RepID=A0A183EDF1_9BILA
LNSLSEQRHWPAHISAVTSVFYSTEAEMIFSCSKDKTAVWHCSETSVKIESITSLAWDMDRQLLYSAATDHLVIMWDIGGKKGQAFELNLTPLAIVSELRQGVTCMHLQESTGRLVTAGVDRVLMIWDVKQLV